MHSSRMRTGRSLTVCCSLLPGGGGGGFSLPGPGGCLPGPGEGFSLPGPGGCLPGPGGVLPARSQGESACWGGFSLPGPGGFYLPGLGGGSPVQGGAARRPPPVNRITHTCKNITLATTSLRPVKNSKCL